MSFLKAKELGSFRKKLFFVASLNPLSTGSSQASTSNKIMLTGMWAFLFLLV
jgi:hypothetical protein